MRVDWCVSSWFRIKNTHSLTVNVAVSLRRRIAFQDIRKLHVEIGREASDTHTHTHDASDPCRPRAGGP